MLNKGKNRFKLAVLMAFLMVSVVLAVSISNFDGFATSENITFTGDENYTRNITIYKDANVTSAFMNLSSINLIDDIADSSYCEVPLGNDCSDIFGDDQNLSTSSVVIAASPRDFYWRENYTIYANQTNINFTWKKKITSGQLSIAYCWNSSGAWDIILSTGTGGTTTESGSIPLDCLNNTNLQIFIHFDYNLVGVAMEMFEGWITYYDKTNNTSILINNTQIWNHTGEFNSTFSPNQTNDFSSVLNSALNSGACDCTGCVLTGDSCNISTIFHSDTAGILGYDAMSINWLEYTNPNATITQPSGSKDSLTVNYNVSVADDWATDTCIYWVTLSTGASHISNQTVTCNSEITGSFNVASDNTNYIFYFWVNDTSGNVNQTSSNFSTIKGAVILAGGGGGSSPPIAQVSVDRFERGKICQPFKDAWGTAVEDSNKMEFEDSLGRILFLWESFWNYALCSGSASTIVPL